MGFNPSASVDHNTPRYQRDVTTPEFADQKAGV